MNTRTKLALALAAATIGATALAQQPTGAGAVVTSEPGKATAARALEITAQVVAIDKASRTVTLKDPKGKVVDIVASNEVRNFDQIKVGDMLVTRFAQALTLELQKVKVAGGEITVQEGAMRAKEGERPAAGGVRQITAIAEVVALDPGKRTLTLKGPRGNLVTLDVQNPDQFKVLKKGDQIQVTYTEALALSMEAAPKPTAKSK